MTLSPEILARLQQLNRERLPATAPLPGSAAADETPADLTLETLVPGTVVETADSGAHYVVSRALRALAPDLARHLDEREGLIVDPPVGLESLAERFPQGVLFLDLETCGFAGSAIFLAGVIRYAEGGLRLEQLLARNYAEERAVLESLWQRVSADDVLVTFNGKSFDWPMVRDRSTYHRFAAREQPGEHVDLLHHARRRWKARLPDCKLQTLERMICRRVRRGDLPGSQVPQEYHHFVRSGDASQMQAILHHNALDLLTLVQLAAHLIAAGQPQEADAPLPRT